MIAAALRLAACLAVILPGALAAAPLCRDTKGLFTPCPHEANRKARTILERAPAVLVQDREHAPMPALTAARPATARPAAGAVAAAPAARAAAVRRPAPRRRLCTDSKGLFTPCPR